jgi:hypothetical protein
VTSRKAALALAASLLLVPLLSACNLGHPGGFTAGSNAFCRQTSVAIAKLTRPASPKAQLQYATDRYTLVERLVSEMTDSSLPGSTFGHQIRDQWLRPARTSLVAGRTVLVDLRTAVNAHDAAAATSQFGRSQAIGTQGVDTGLLQAHGLGDCAKVFEPTAV